MKQKHYWDGIINSVDVLLGILKRKPKQFKIGFQCNPGSILNAYREGDVTFDKAVKEIEAWKDRRVKEAFLEQKLSGVSLYNMIRRKK